MIDLDEIKADLEPRPSGFTASAGEVKWRGRCRELVAEVEGLEADVELLKSAGGWATLFESKATPLLEQARQEERARIIAAVKKLLITPEEVAEAFKDKPDAINGSAVRWSHNSAIENALQLIEVEPREP